MHLVARERDAVAGFAMHRLEPLVAAEHGLDIEQAEALGRAGVPFDAARIVDAASEHLIPAAEPEDIAATAQVRSNVDVETSLPKRGEVRNRRLRSGQDDEVGVAHERRT